jgi:predicted Co/Zn/Cd cation transporter (cation efflux family)
VSPEYRIDIAKADEIRSEVSARLDAASPAFWLTIDFTADRRWL